MECIIFVLFIILMIILFFDIIVEHELDFLFRIISYVILLIIFILCIIYRSKPQAIDVYRDKTTLEITYKDTIPIDSTVVWKSK